jgi:hypothetical protein
MLKIDIAFRPAVCVANLKLVGLPAAGGRQRLPDREQTVLLQKLRDARGVLGLRDLPRLDALDRVRLKKRKNTVCADARKQA